MTEERARANGEILPNEFDISLNKCQSSAVLLSGLLEAAFILDNEGGQCANAVTSIIAVAMDMADKLANDMDSVNRPEVTS